LTKGWPLLTKGWPLMTNHKNNYFLQAAIIKKGFRLLLLTWTCCGRGSCATHMYITAHVYSHTHAHTRAHTHTHTYTHTQMLCFPGRPLTTVHLGNVNRGTGLTNADGTFDAPHTSVQSAIPPIQVCVCVCVCVFVCVFVCLCVCVFV